MNSAREGKDMVRKAGFMGLFLFLVMIMPRYPAHAQTPQDTLNQYVSSLQQNPSDNALREKIIKFAQTMNPAPAIPEEARRDYVIGLTLFKGKPKTFRTTMIQSISSRPPCWLPLGGPMHTVTWAWRLRPPRGMTRPSVH